MKLLNIDANAKTVKGQKEGYLTAILYLAPYNVSGYQVCPLAELAGCVNDCLFTAGRGAMKNVKDSRIAKTRLFFEDRAKFMELLVDEIVAAKKKAQKMGFTLVVRLNGTSDIAWERVPVGDFNNIMEMFSDIQFYDYTKIPNRRNLPKNYHLTFSYSARPAFSKIVQKALSHYGESINLAAVFQGVKLPDQFLGRKVINADETDLRFTDPTGTVAGLVAKGKARKSLDGFVIAA
jgi:hypothetical protein